MSLKNILVSGAAALALVGTAATAVTIEADGTGDFLLAPVYYANGPWETTVKVVNTNTTNAVVAKVVIRGGKDSKELLDFPIYLTPGDVWEGRLYMDTDGHVKFTSQDDSLMLGRKFKTVAIETNESNCSQTTDFTIIEPTQVGINGFDITAKKSQVPGFATEEERRGYIEIFGLAEYNVSAIANRFHGVWTEGCDFNKTLLYSIVRNTENSSDINITCATDVVNSDLMGEQTIYAPSDVDAAKRYMKLNLLALGDVSYDVAGDDDGVMRNVLGTNTLLSNVSRVTYPAIAAALSKKHIYVMYEGNANGDDIAPMQTLFTFPFMKAATPNGAGLSDYAISTTDIIFRDMTEEAIDACGGHYECSKALGECRETGGNNGDAAIGDISAPVYTSECPDLNITDEVGVIFDHDPSSGIRDTYVDQYAYRSGGYIDIKVNDLPVVPTTIKAKDVNGLYLNNHQYNQYNK